MKLCNIITTFKGKNELLYVEFVIFFLSFTLMVNNPAIARDSNKRITIKIQKTIPLGEQLTIPNCIYEIYDGFNLCNSSFTLPDNVVLRFKGGCFSNGTIVGKKTTIEAPFVYILRNVSLQGTWQNESYHPEWFGAVGDGKTDDTEGIRQAMIAAKGKTLQFQRKTYIINVKAGTNNDDQRTIFSGCKCAEMFGSESVIKLGDNDNCNLYKYKGFGSIFSIYTIESFHVKGITFDFNYEKNPIYQTQGVRQDIQENTQLNAFQFRRVRKVVIEDCKFVGHSGTNCIDYNDARYDEGDKVFEVTIENCEFLKCGGKSFYKSNNTLEDAYHDCSTIALHYCGKNHDTRFVVNVANNYFEGIGGNAYNAIETDASELNFRGNTIKNFASCIFPCVGIYDGKISIRDNHFFDVSRGIVLWLRGGTDEDSHRYGYNNLEIAHNECVINMGKWLKTERYDNIGTRVSNRYGFIFTTSGNNKSVMNLSIVDNTVKYNNYKSVPTELCSKAVVNFETAGKDVTMMRCDNMVVSRNKFYNAVNRVLNNYMFQEICRLVFDNNYIFNPFSVQKANSETGGGGIISLNHSRAYAPSLDYPTISNFTATGNNIIYGGYHTDDGCAVIVNSMIFGENNSTSSSLIVKGNRCTSNPQYGMVHFSFMKKLFKTIEIDGQ